MDDPKNICLSWPAKLIMIAVVLMLLSPSVSGLFFTDHDARSKWEKRTLTDLPPIQDVVHPKIFFSRFNSFLNDHMGFSLFANRFYRKLLLNLFKDTPASRITIGKDGFIFMNDHRSGQKYGVFNTLCRQGRAEKPKQRYMEALLSFIDSLTSRGYRVTIAAPVSKPVLYPEKLPNSVPGNLVADCLEFSRHKNAIHEIMETMQGKNVLVFYPYELFAKHKYEPYFYPKQNFHWSGKSTHLFAATLLSKLGIQMDENFSSQASLIESFSDTSNILGFKYPIRVWEYNYDEYGITSDNTYLAKLLEGYYETAVDFSCYRTKFPITKRRLLILSDSFGKYIAKDLAPAYKETFHTTSCG